MNVSFRQMRLFLALAETGSVSFMFDHVGLIAYPLDKGSEDAMLEVLGQGPHLLKY
jgi:transcriptional/translational regulatory protein YebC/TACO1